MPSESLTGVVATSGAIFPASAPRPYRKRGKARIISRARKNFVTFILISFSYFLFLILHPDSGLSCHRYRQATSPFPKQPEPTSVLPPSPSSPEPLFRSPGRPSPPTDVSPNRAYFGVQFRIRNPLACTDGGIAATRFTRYLPFSHGLYE